MHIKVNSNKIVVEQVRKELAQNDGYCPCQTEKTPDTKCICKNFREQQEEGYCYCMLYYKFLD